MASKNQPRATHTPKALTANRLDDGLVVFLTAAGNWSHRLGDARVAAGLEASRALETAGARDVAACRVVGPYLVDITHENGEFRPLRLRERVRAFGPTVSAGTPR